IHEDRYILIQNLAANRLRANKSSILYSVESKRGSSIYIRLSTLYTDGQSTSGHHPPNGEHWIWRSHITVASGRKLGIFIETRLLWHFLRGLFCGPVINNIATNGIYTWETYCVYLLMG